jgi:triacylglycerol lipase
LTIVEPWPLRRPELPGLGRNALDCGRDFQMSFLVQLSRSAYPGHALDKFAATAPFSLNNARSMMWMAQLAYETPGDNGDDEAAAKKKVADILDGWQMKLRGFKRNDPLTGLPHRSACMVAGGGRGATIIAFAGSDPLKVEDWVTDFTPAPSLDDVHRGFEGAVNSVWDDIEATIGTRPSSEQPLFFTGHSLGGALAIIAADFAVTRLHVNATAVYTFGSPRTGGQEFFDRYTPPLGNATFRLVDGDDVVASVPQLSGVFRHVGRRMQCPSDGSFDGQTLQAPDEDKPDFVAGALQSGLDDIRAWTAFRFIRGIGPRPLDKLAALLPRMARDHVPGNYFRALGMPLR